MRRKKIKKMITVAAEIPEEVLEDWRLFVVLHGGRIMPNGDPVLPETITAEIIKQVHEKKGGPRK